jgi:hypothetical protein
VTQSAAGQCEWGDVALVIRTPPGCEANLGRAVLVHGPLKFRKKLGATWVIKPVRRTPWAVSHRDGTVTVEKPSLRDIECPDAWLLLIKRPWRRPKGAPRRGPRPLPMGW